MPRKTKYKHPLTWYADRYAVGIATIKRYSAQDVDLDDPAAVDLHVAVQKHQPENFSTYEAPTVSNDRPYKERVSIEQRVYDFLVYVNGVDSLVASKAASLVFSSNLSHHLKMTEEQEFSPDNPHGCDRVFQDDKGGKYGTWMIPEEVLEEDLEEIGWTPAQAKKYLKQAAEIDRAELRREGIIK